MSNNKKKHQNQRPQMPANRQENNVALPADASAMTQTPIAAMLQESMNGDLTFSATIRQGSKELDVDYTPPQDGEGVTLKRELNLKFRDK